MRCVQSRAGADPRLSGVVADSASFAIKERAREHLSSTHPEHERTRIYNHSPPIVPI